MMISISISISINISIIIQSRSSLFASDSTAVWVGGCAWSAWNQAVWTSKIRRHLCDVISPELWINRFTFAIVLGHGVHNCLGYSYVLRCSIRPCCKPETPRRRSSSGIRDSGRSIATRVTRAPDNHQTVDNSDAKVWLI